MKIFAKCRNCAKVYEEAKARGDWKGFCSAKCQHEKAYELGFRKHSKISKLYANSEVSILTRAKAIGSVFVVQVNGQWIEAVQKPVSLHTPIPCPDCGKEVLPYTSSNDRLKDGTPVTKLQLHDDPKGQRCPGGGLWTALIPSLYQPPTVDPEDAEDEAKRPERINLREAFRTYVQHRLQEYISEGEHQDGEGYWDQFKDVKEVVDDFACFLQACEGE